MSQVYSRTIKAIGDVETIYDRLMPILATKGFNVIAQERPNLIVADRGMIRPTLKVNKTPHSLVVAFHSTDGSPLISFSYVMSDMWNYTPGDQSYFNWEINSVVAAMNTNSANIDLRSTQDVASQAYIGELQGLAKLRDEGVISREEFDRKKRTILGI
ncbi:MAG: SHOCT domain-containing protein [Methanomassiliicoccus sp.]|nr:SHOCT domain-containing protein [Methanomassiliicoccus sp.]